MATVAGVPPAAPRTSPTRLAFVLGITALTLAHHLDHSFRGVTGWPVTDEFNAFTVSLFVYPVIAMGLVRTVQGRAGSRFWMILAGGGALFVVFVHVGPAAGDLVTRIPDQYASPVADVAAVLVLAALVAALLGHFAYEAVGGERGRRAIEAAEPGARRPHTRSP